MICQFIDERQEWNCHNIFYFPTTPPDNFTLSISLCSHKSPLAAHSSSRAVLVPATSTPSARVKDIKMAGELPCAGPEVTPFPPPPLPFSLSLSFNGIDVPGMLKGFCPLPLCHCLLESLPSC